jgi:hypothetical protein
MGELSKTLFSVALDKMKTEARARLAGKTYDIDGEAISIDEVCAEIDSFEAEALAVDAANATAKKLLDGHRARQQTKMKPRYEQMKRLLKLVYGPSSPALVPYGIKPRKPPKPKSAKTLVSAQEKAAATREARHTVGPKQRKKIKGVVGGAPSGATPATSGGGSSKGGVSRRERG